MYAMQYIGSNFDPDHMRGQQCSKIANEITVLNFTKITLGLHQLCTGIIHICNSRVGCNILVAIYRVIIRLKVQLG